MLRNIHPQITQITHKGEVFGLLWPGKLKRLKAVNCRPVSEQRECPPIFEANIK